MKLPGGRPRARLTDAVSRYGPQVAIRYARLVARARAAQLAAAARLRPRDVSGWTLAWLRGALVALVGAGAVLAVKVVLAVTP